MKSMPIDAARSHQRMKDLSTPWLTAVMKIYRTEKLVPQSPMMFSRRLLLAVGRNAKMHRMGPKMNDHVLHETDEAVGLLLS